MKRRTLWIALPALLLAGCAQPAMQPPIAADSPANPDAPESPLPHESQTLAQDGPDQATGESPAQPGETAAPSAPPSTPSTVPATAPATAAASAAAVYTCPMHPKVVSSAPGKCPICGMKLVLKKAGDQSAPHPVQDHAAHGDNGGRQ